MTDSDLIKNFLNNGGKIKYGKTRRRKDSISFPVDRGPNTLSNLGRKANNLRNSGLSKAN